MASDTTTNVIADASTALATVGVEGVLGFLSSIGALQGWESVWNEIDYFLTPSVLDEGTPEECMNVLKTFMTGTISPTVLETSTPKENIFYCYWLMSHEKSELLEKFVRRVPADAYYVVALKKYWEVDTLDETGTGAEVEEAVSLFQKCVDNGDNRGYYYLGLLYKRMGKEEEMMTAWLDGVQNGAEMCFIGLSTHHFEKNDADLGISYLEQGASVGSIASMHRLGQLLQENGDKDTGAAYLNQAATNGCSLAMMDLLLNYVKRNDNFGIAGLIPFILTKRSPIVTVLIQLLHATYGKIDPETGAIVEKLLKSNFYPKVPNQIMSRIDLQLIIAALDEFSTTLNSTAPTDDSDSDYELPEDEVGSSLSTGTGTATD